MEGFAAGIAEAITSQGQMQEQSQQKALFPYILEQNSIKTQQDQISLQQSQVGLKQQQMQLAALTQATASGELGGPKPLTEQLRTMSEIAIRSGNVEEARKLAETASTMDANTSLVQERSAAGEAKMWGTVGDLVANVHDEGSWQQAKMLFQTAHPDWMKNQMVQQIFGKGYNPAMVAQLSQLSVTQKDQAEIAAAKARVKQSDATIKLDAARTRQAEATAALEGERMDNLKKAGVKPPTAGQVSVIREQMLGLYDDPADMQQKADFDNRAMRVTERMLQLEAGGIPRSVASVKAFSEAQKAGDFSGLKPRVGAGVPGKPSSPTKPLAVPNDVKSMQDNEWYDVGGTPKLYMKSTGQMWSQEELDELSDESSDDADER